jgi:hypothetical protein
MFIFSPFLLSLFFGLGVVSQAYLLVRHQISFKSFLKRVLGCFLLSFFICLRVFLEIEVKQIYISVFTFFLIFSILFGVFSKNEILPEISEQTLLSFTLVFWYIFFTHFHRINYLFWLALLPSLGVLIISFVSAKLGFVWKLFFYTWFLLMIVFSNIFYFSFGNLSFFFNPEKIKKLSPIDVFLTGMVFLYLVSHVWYILELVPYRHRRSRKEMIAEWKEHAQLLIGKYSDFQLLPIHSFFIILFGGGILLLNYFLKILPDDLIISLSILIIPQLISERWYNLRTNIEYEKTSFNNSRVGE